MTFTPNPSFLFRAIVHLQLRSGSLQIKKKAIEYSNQDFAHAKMAEQDVELVPGTEVMTELSGMHLVHAHGSPGSVVLVPQPTSDPHDPLVCYVPVPSRMIIGCFFRI